MSHEKNIMKVAEISSENIANINDFQSKIKTLENKDVVLIAYEK